MIFQAGRAIWSGKCGGFTAMDRRCRQLLKTVILMLAMAVSFTAAVFASDDNSLASLGIKTQGVTVSPEFRYDIWEYSVEVPAGTKTLEMEPHTTNPNATVNSVTGTTLADDGTGTVVITVTSESGNAIEYTLNVTSARGQVDPAEAIAANEGTAATIDTEIVLQSEVETEDPRYVKVDRNSLEDAEKTIEKLQKTITEQRSHISMMTYVLYALIAVSIVFLFIVISQLLRRRDMAQELAIYRQNDPYQSGEGYVAEDGWGEWGEDDAERSHKKKKKKHQPAEDDDWDDEPENAASSWVDEQIGTPVQPQRVPPKSYPAGDQRQPRRNKNGQSRSAQNSRQRQTNGGQARQNTGAYRQTNGGQARQNTGAPRQTNGGQSRQNTGAPRQTNGGQARQNTGAYRQANGGQPRQNTGASRQTGAGQSRQGSQRTNVNGQRVSGNTQRLNGSGQRKDGSSQRQGGQQRSGNYDETRRYQAVQPVHVNEVPKDVTKDLNRMSKAEQKAMKKAAAVEARREQEARRAAQAREAEAKRQAQEADRLRKEQAAAQAAQEEALRQAAAQRAQAEAESGANASGARADGDKNVKIDIVDL